MKNILALNPSEAKNFFFNQESYTNIDLPPYFDFVKLIRKIDKLTPSKVLKETDLKKAQKYETVNHVLYGNKDGKYSWRKYEIINPLIYVSLVNLMTEKTNWGLIKECFKRNEQNEQIECTSIPVNIISGKKRKATQIDVWVEKVERRSIYLSLEYKFLYQTDISDCYPSIYTHSIPWAIHTKTYSKSKRKFQDLLGNKIDCHIRSMSFGQTNGIPQGSVLMDFIAEVVLSYADSKLSEKLQTQLKDKNYHILRFRDDYRIFVNDMNDGDIILKSISETLIDLGLKLNTSKTVSFDNVVSGSVKKDKLYDLIIEPVPKVFSRKEVFRQLLIVQQIGTQFPNTGTVKRRLEGILKGIQNKYFFNQEMEITSLLVDIGYNNPVAFPIIAFLISKCISKLSKPARKEIISKIQNKVCLLSNIGLLEIWMQRISLKMQPKVKYNEKLCKIISDEHQRVFETNWITDSRVRTLIDKNTFVDRKVIRKSGPVINASEVRTLVITVKVNFMYKLSPSDFAYLYEECKLCYYLKVKYGIEQPKMPMPGVFSAMNTRLQGSVVGKNLKTISKDLPDGNVLYQEGWVESKTIPGTSLFLKGKYDLLVENSDNTFTLVDLKISQQDVEKIDKYKTQLNAYKFALENPKYDKPIKITKLGLLVFYPDQVVYKDNSVFLSFPPKWFEVPIDDNGFLSFITETDTLLSGPTPQEGKDCKWCKYRHTGDELAHQKNAEEITLPF